MISESLLEPLVEAPSLLIALDFDGTLAPLVADPSDSRMVPEIEAVLAELRALPGVSIAFISGRAFESLIHVARPEPSDFVSGSHGLEIREPGGQVTLLAPADALEKWETLRSVLTDVARTADGAWVEEKPAGFAVHTRALSDTDAALLNERAIQAVANKRIDATTRAGHGVREFALAHSDKGQAVEHFRVATGADSVLFAGDDVTDEDGFAVMGLRDLGIKVGDGHTRARARVAHPRELAAVLERLAHSRS